MLRANAGPWLGRSTGLKLCSFQLFNSEREFARWRQDERRGMSSEAVYAYIRNRGALYATASAIRPLRSSLTRAAVGSWSSATPLP